MSDFDLYTVTLVTLEADAESPVYITNRQYPIEIDTNLYIPSPEMHFDLPRITGDLGSEEGKIETVRIQGSVLSNIAGGYPYNDILVTVKEVELNSVLAVVSEKVLFKGKVYQSKTTASTGYTNLVLRDWKYYLDVTAGLPCTENCFVKHFGDSMCQATVASHPVIVDSIVGNEVTLIATPSAVDFLFSKGYFRYKGTSIKIKYWESGLIFQTSELMPASWEGPVITLLAGCDKRIETCRDIHNNEVHFSGWGYSMIDYNAQLEDG